MKRGFSASTIALVVVLLGMLLWVGHIVNPPPAAGAGGHDDEQPPAAKQATPPPNRKEMEARYKAEMKRHMPPPKSRAQIDDAIPTARKGAHGTATPAPHAAPQDNMNAGYWQDHDMGPSAAQGDGKTK